MPDDPTNILDVKADAAMMAAYMKFAKRRLFLNEVLFYFDKGNAQALYPKYFDRKSSSCANIDGPAYQVAEKLAKAGDWKNAAWPKVLAEAKNFVRTALDPEVVNGFVKSDEYKDYLKTQKMGSPDKAAKLLGIKDVKKLKLAMEAIVTGDHATAKKLLGDIMVKEVLKGRAEDLIKTLEKSRLV